MSTKAGKEGSDEKRLLKSVKAEDLTAASALMTIGQLQNSSNHSHLPPSPIEGNAKWKSYSFPKQLMIMINWCSELPSSTVVWLPEGDAFAIIDPAEFTRDILPRFFKKAKFESFTRKLYRWGFRQFAESSRVCDDRLISPVERNAYKAIGFHRDRPELCSTLRVQYSNKEKLFQLNKLQRNRSASTNNLATVVQKEEPDYSRGNLASVASKSDNKALSPPIPSSQLLQFTPKYQRESAHVALQRLLGEISRRQTLQQITASQDATVMLLRQSYTGSHLCSLLPPIMQPAYPQVLFPSLKLVKYYHGYGLHKEG